MPLILLAGALKAVEAIQQGCELYKEYKGTVLKAKETFDEAKSIAIEVSDVGTGIWDFIKSKLFNTDNNKNDPPPKTETKTQQETTEQKVTESVTKQTVEWDEQEIKKNLVKNLKIFFKAMIAIHKKIAQQQERIDHEVIDPDELLDVSLDLVVAKKEMEKAQKDIREVMVYQSPPELGALYSDVVEMFGIVQEKQEATHLLNLRKRKEEWQRKNRLLSKVRQRIAWVVVMALIVLETWGLIASIHLARRPM
jgi:hypothetical protein